MPNALEIVQKKTFVSEATNKAEEAKVYVDNHRTT